MLNRRNQLWVLIFLSALTALAQYVIQGGMASGHNPSQFPNEFWYADFGLWGARALIEAWVIVYLFSTRPETRAQSRILSIFEIALIGLITLTLGPALRSLGYGEAMRETLSEPWFSAWNFGIAAYTSLMMGAAGLAYKIQPHDEGGQLIAAEKLKEFESLQNELNRAQSEVDASRAAVQSVNAFAALPENVQVKWIAENRNGDAPNNTELARMYDVHPSTITRWIKEN